VTQRAARRMDRGRGQRGRSVVGIGVWSLMVEKAKAPPDSSRLSRIGSHVTI